MQPVTCANDYLTRQRCRRVKVEVEGIFIIAIIRQIKLETPRVVLDHHTTDNSSEKRAFVYTIVSESFKQNYSHKYFQNEYLESLLISFLSF